MSFSFHKKVAGVTLIVIAGVNPQPLSLRVAHPTPKLHSPPHKGKSERGRVGLHVGGGGGYLKTFWVEMCHWDPGTLSLYQS